MSLIYASINLFCVLAFLLVPRIYHSGLWQLTVTTIMFIVTDCKKK